MPRVGRVVLPGYPHHVTHRGSQRQDVFLKPDDYQRYLGWLRKYADAAETTVWAYCLMTNHIHLILVPQHRGGLADLMRPPASLYAQHLKLREERAEHFRGARFYSCPVDLPYLPRAVRYVERNPVRAGLVTQAEHYPWSSASCHCAGRGDSFYAASLPLLQSIPHWSEWLRNEDETEVADLRIRTRRGVPCGSNDFVRTAQESR